MTDDKLSSSNQGKPEPVPVSHSRPAEQSTAGSADPQAPRRDAGSRGDPHGAAVAGHDDAPGTSEQLPPTAVNPTGVGRSEEDATDRAAGTPTGTPAGAQPAEGQPGGSATQAAQEGRPLAHGKAAGTHPASQAVVGRSGAPDGEVSAR